MPDHVYKRIDLTGTSTQSIEDAVQKAVAKAAQTLHGLRWFEIADIRGDIEGNKVSHWQVSLKVGFTLDE
jgi:dodecin